jgi:DNA-binding beta-propeller fold protein YncE/mono/diheme cytochrome c family protein
MIAWFAACLSLITCTSSAAGQHNSPVDLAIVESLDRLVVVSQGTNTVSLISRRDGRVIDQAACGEHPIRVRIGRAGKVAYVVCSNAQMVERFELAPQSISRLHPLRLPDHPADIVFDTDRATAYVSLQNHGAVVTVDLATGRIRDPIKVGRGAGMLALSGNGRFIAVSVGSLRGFATVDLRKKEVYARQSFMGINFGHLATNRQGTEFYFPWMVYRDNPITADNIRKGWVLASRIGRHKFTSEKRRESMSLDPPGRAIADPTDVALTTADDIVISSAGTHEVVVVRHENLPWKTYGGTDHLPDELQRSPNRFRRIRVGGRPMGIELSGDDRTLYIANYLLGAVQVLDIDSGELSATWPLAQNERPSLARQGEAIFYDARRSLDQWYSCHSCHQHGGSNAVAMDTLTDGSPLTKKTVLPLYSLQETGPYSWHGWQNELRASLEGSLNKTMLGRGPTSLELDALEAFLQTLKSPVSPYEPGTPAAERGKELFVGRTGCSECHSLPLGTDGGLHDVGLGGTTDRYPTFNTPTLTGVYRKLLLLHDGRVSSLEELFEEGEHPGKVLRGELDQQEIADLIAFLRSL